MDDGTVSRALPDWIWCLFDSRNTAFRHRGRYTQLLLGGSHFCESWSSTFLKRRISRASTRDTRSRGKELKEMGHRSDLRGEVAISLQMVENLYHLDFA
jgi:hypothetical protein